jgi:hypothetical protein
MDARNDRVNITNISSKARQRAFLHANFFLGSHAFEATRPDATPEARDETRRTSPSQTASHDPAAVGFVRDGGVTRRSWDLFAPARRDAVASIWIPQLPGPRQPSVARSARASCVLTRCEVSVYASA